MVLVVMYQRKSLSPPIRLSPAYLIHVDIVQGNEGEHHPPSPFLGLLTRKKLRLQVERVMGRQKSHGYT